MSRPATTGFQILFDTAKISEGDMTPLEVAALAGLAGGGAYGGVQGTRAGSRFLGDMQTEMGRQRGALDPKVKGLGEARRQAPIGSDKRTSIQQQLDDVVATRKGLASRGASYGRGAELLGRRGARIGGGVLGAGAGLGLAALLAGGGRD